MSLYQPSCTLTQVQGTQWRLRTVVDVANAEGLRLISNSVSGDTRTVTYDVIGGPGGQIVEIETLIRQSGENHVKVIVEKDKKKKGETTTGYN